MEDDIIEVASCLWRRDRVRARGGADERAAGVLECLGNGVHRIVCNHGRLNGGVERAAEGDGESRRVAAGHRDGGAGDLLQQCGQV